MFLSLSTIPSYLTSRGHISPSQWFDEGLQLVPAPGRHANFVLRDACGSGMFVKQLRELNRELIDAQTNEAAMLTAIQEWPCWSDQRLVAPRLIDHDMSRHVLMIDYIAGKSFYEAYLAHQNHGDAAATKRISILLGEALAKFHLAGRRLNSVDPSQKQKLKSALPAAITLQPPDDSLDPQLSPACRQLLDSIQNDSDFIDQLRTNGSHWRQESVIHGDLKWDNVLVTDQRDVGVRLVDWELAAIGDPAWDVAGVLQSFATHAADQLALVDSDGGNTHRDGDAFWTAYIDSLSLRDHELFKDRVRRFFSARLIQTVFEREHQSQTTSATSNRLIQISRKVLCESNSTNFPGN